MGIPASHIPAKYRPETPPRAQRFTGAHTQRKRRTLAAMRNPDTLENRWLTRWRAIGGPEPVPQFKFHPTRKWRFDFAWPSKLLAVEVDGGTWIGGGHSRGSGQQRDAEKLNAAAAMGWRVFRFTSDMVRERKGFAELLGAVTITKTQEGLFTK